MADSKRGLLGRLFGGEANAPAEDAPEIIKSDEALGVSEGWWQRLKSGLARSSQSLSTGIADVFTKKKLDAESLEELEELLLKADLGLETAAKVTEARIYGFPVEALCGERFVPQQDPKKLPLCGICKEIYDLYRSMSDGNLNESPSD